MNKAKSLVDRLLSISSVRIDNVTGVTHKLAKMIDGGRQNLHFISDFDMTMSLYWVRNKQTYALERNISSHRVISRYSKMTPEYTAETDRIFNKYYPIEVNHNMTWEEKLPFMIQWWTEAHESIIRQRLTRQDIEQMPEEISVDMRPCLDKLIKTCNAASIPFLVFSAGIGDVIRSLLRKSNSMYDNMHIVSNMMIFDENDVCVGFEDPLIHIFNKSEFQLESSPYHKMIEERKNVILLGDSTGDLQMSQGIQHELCFNIGFLNHNIEELEPTYLEAFDIVIEGDANMEPVVEILKCIQ
ncbi:pyrimidine 5'-nucleotidase [Pilobolus umbonatus]|nr:pyrimidine 5'-nucleotidase [Pilobolus umbonatus]